MSRAPLSAIQSPHIDSGVPVPASYASQRCAGAALEGCAPHTGRHTSSSPSVLPLKTEQVAARLEATQSLSLRRIAARLRQCIARDANGNRPLGTNRCGHALCPACQAGKAKNNQSELVRQLRRTRDTDCFHIRVSVVVRDGLKHASRALALAFGALRRRKPWSDVVAGGAAYTDLLDPAGPNSATRWNPHLHAIIELVHGTKLNLPALRAALTELLTTALETGSIYADRVYSTNGIHYVNRHLRQPLAYYVTRRARGEELLVLDDNQLGEVARALPGARTIVWFGTWRAARAADRARRKAAREATP